MSDQPSQPPKPKPGSLRDRIAAFEKTANAAPAPAAAPAPRPKPAGFASWKPKAPSPPSSPSASATSSTEHTSVGASKVGTMSASDAKESITKGGSLKDRMAALQGKGAFGAPVPPTAPKPAVERPKWKPPPVVQAPADDDDQTGEHATAAIAAAVERTLSPPVSLKSSESAEIVSTPEVGDDSAAPSVPVEEGGQEGEQTVVDPEEEERQRRAAIAARMARLGGARVGMAPPTIGKKPPVRRPTQEEAPVPPKEESKPSEEPVQADIVGNVVPKPVEGPSRASDVVGSPPSDAPVQQEQTISPDVPPTRKNSEAASIKSSDTTDSQSSRNPTSMPVPSVPRRAGPPRKKPAKAPTLPPSDVTEEKPEETIEPPVEPAAENKPEASVDAAVSQKTTDTVAELDNNTSLDEATAKLPEQSALIEEAVKIIEHQDPKILEDEPESEPISNIEEEVPESASSIYLQSPLAPSTLVEETNGVRSPPPSSLSSAQEVIPEADVLTSPIVIDSPPVPVLHSAPHALHVDELDKTPHEDVEGNEDPEEEEARKKRVADRIAKMGGINPFAPRPVAPVSPPAEEPRSPPLATATFVPSDSATPVVVPAASAEPEHKADPSLDHTQTPSPPKETDVGSKYEQDSSSDEDEGDSEVRDKQWSPSASATHEQVEKPNTVAEPHPGLDIASSLPAPPPIPTSTRPTVQVQQYVVQDKDDGEGEDEESDYGDVDSVDEKPVAVASPPSRPSNPPQPSDAVAAVPASSQHLSEAPPPPHPNRPAQPPRRIIPQAPEHLNDEEVEEDEETDEEADERLATSQLFVPPPSGRGPIAIQPRGGLVQGEEEDGDGSENDSPALPVPHRVSVEGVPAKPPVPAHDEDSETDSDHDGQALPIPPRRPVVPRIAPPPFSSSQEEGGQQQQPSQTISPPGQSTPSLSVSGSEEILDEEEGDPIDPAFHSPSRQTSFVNLRSISQAQEEIDAQSPISPSIGRSSLVHSPVVAPPAAPPSAAPHDDDNAEEDAEQLRRKTIAERMAKLGGIRFGAAPIPTPISRPPPRQSEEEDQKEGESSAAVNEEPAAPLSEEEEERARKERIAAKLATMGGMRIGMMMGAGGLPPPPPRSHMVREENVDRASAPAPAVPPAPPTRAVPPSRPPPPPAAQDTDSEYGSVAASEEGVKVEAGESEAEESGYEHVEEAPPPVPSRAARPSINRQSTGPSSPPSRPSVPTALPMRRSSTLQSSTSMRNVSGGDGASSPPHRTPQMPHTEYVMVEEPESQEAPPPPPARPAARPPPSRSAPQAPQPPPMHQRPDLGDSISSQWELPSIPNSSLDFSGASDLTMSWTDAGAEPTSPVVAAQPSSPPAPPPPTKPPAPLANDRQLSADELIALWGRVGVQVCEVATSLFEKSRKTLIGDGSYAGFVREVLAAVPNAAPAPTAAGEPYGYTIYVQNGPAVVKRVSDIMPGDLVEIQDAKLKGHKGLQTYHQSVGAAGETLVGVVGEFEAKKSKIRVFQANQHVGQQTVESVSYRLEDLKSGLVKVYRVLDA
uniref:BBC1/AIM3 cysteine proteinase-fold domain-containing protein n=1 Tax=Psilocybe cubensis TaxID=181762 RepID=A0A8H8CHM2_PSICU